MQVPSVFLLPEQAHQRGSHAHRLHPHLCIHRLLDVRTIAVKRLLTGHNRAGLAPTARQFFLCWTIIILTALAAQALGIAVSAMVSTEKLAFALAPFITIILILFGASIVVTNANDDDDTYWLTCQPRVDHAQVVFTPTASRSPAGWHGSSTFPLCTIRLLAS